MWQSAYAELYITDTLWPLDFTKWKWLKHFWIILTGNAGLEAEMNELLKVVLVAVVLIPIVLIKYSLLQGLLLVISLLIVSFLGCLNTLK